jgi:hypothetical protein
VPRGEIASARPSGGVAGGVRVRGGGGGREYACPMKLFE